MGLGAAPADTWTTVRATLPPVSSAPDDDTTSIAAPIPTSEPQLASPSPAIPTRMPARPGAPVVPAGDVPPAPVPAPATTPTPTPVAEASPLVAGAATRVYVVNGVDPFGISGLRTMTDRLRANGYDTQMGRWFQATRFEREIRQLNSQQPGTPVVIIGYSFGVYRAKAMANRLTRDGVPVAMVGYVGGDYLRNTSSSMAGVGQVVNVRGNGFLLTGRNLFFTGTDLSGADNRRLSVRHFDLPKQTETLDALVAGINSSTGNGIVTPGTGVATTAPVTVASSPLGTLSPAQAAATPADIAPPRGTRPLFRLTGRGDR